MLGLGSAFASVPPNGPVTQLGTAASVANNSTLSSYLVPAGNNRLLVVTVSTSDESGASTDITGVTYGGQAMSLGIKHPAGVATDSIWYRVMGSSGSSTTADIVASVTVTTGGTTVSRLPIAISAIAFQTVNQTTPISHQLGNDGSGSAATLSVTSVTGDLVLDLLDIYDTADTGTETPISGQTVMTTVGDPGGGTSGIHGFYKTSTKTGASTPVAMSWTISGTAYIQVAVDIQGALPDIRVQQPLGTELSDNISTINYSSVNIGSTLTNTFTITNGTGNNADLASLSISKDGTNPGDFTVGTLGTTIVPPGGSTTFTVIFSPGAAGSRSAAIHIANNVPGSKNPFDIALTGTGVNATAPDIGVQQPLGTDLTDGVSSIGFGTANVGGSVFKTFTITNTGTADLTGLAININGTNPGDFTPGPPDASTVAPNASTTFVVLFKPVASGARSAALHIANNVSGAKNPFDIALTGTGNAIPTISPQGPLTRAQGAAPINSVIAYANDVETPSGSLIVTAITVPTGITVANIVPSGGMGSVTADVSASGAAALGNNTVVLQVSDGAATSTGNLTVNVTPPPDLAPTALALSNTNIAENQPSGTTVGGFSDTDPDAGDTASYALVSGTGSTDNGSFTINGTNLLTAASFDYETKNSYSILVAVTDSGGLSFTNQFTINVFNINDAPSGANNTITFNEDTSYTFALGDYGFSDSDVPPNNFNRVKLTTLPSLGTLTLNGNAVNAGDTVSTPIPAGLVWTARDSNRNWFSMASSADGSKLVAVEAPGQIYTSTDSGTNWTARDSNRNWFSVASSADGSKLVAAELGGLYTSIDSGVTWTPRFSNRRWVAVASSADGTNLVAVVNSGQIYTSTDSGVTWMARDSNRAWVCVASSADGSKLVAGVHHGQIYTSTDSGTNWTARDSNRNWFSVSSSADGNKLVAAELGGQIYTSTALGSLVFTPATHAYGSPYASFTFQVGDDGGTANGGVDLDPTPRTMTINVALVDSPPTAIALSNTNTAENQPSGTTVGTFSDTDADAGDTASYTLVNGTGSTDNASFTISGTNLLTAASFDYETKSNYSILVAVTDSHGLSFTNQFTIQVTNVNEAPTAIALSHASIAENQPSGTTVGGFSDTDPDVGDTASYTLVSGTGSTDNGSFTISGTNLLTAASFDFETKNSYSILVAVTDGGGLSFTNQFTVQVTDVNEAPTAIALNNNSVAENQPTGTVVGTFSDTDPDANDTASYALVSSAGSTDNASFTIAGTALKTTASFDYETKNSYSILVAVTDSGGLSFTNQFTINVTNVNEAPTDIALSHASIAENKPVGCTIGAFSDTDPDANDTAAYTLVTGTGSDDNASFSISGNNLKSAVSFNYEAKNSYTIRVRVTDGGGLYFEKQFTITIVNVNEQPVVAVDTTTLTGTNHVAMSNTGTFSDPDGNDTATVTASVGSVTQNTNAGTWSWSYTPSAVASSPVTVTITVTDNGTPALTNTTTFTYTDFDPIALTCPGDLLISAPTANGIAVIFTNTVAGGCSSPVITAVPASGSVFPMGDTLVNVSATDSCGHTQTCSFYVTVIKTVPAIAEFLDAKNTMPPTDSSYLGLPLTPVNYYTNIILQDLRLRNFSQSLAIPTIGLSRTDSYTAATDFTYSRDGGRTFIVASNTATISVLSTHSSDVTNKNFLDTEMLSLTLTIGTGQNALMLRESPTKASLGKETLRGTVGAYWISGFYDIFTEVSLDGGNTWIASHAPIHAEMRLVPKNPKSPPAGN